MNQITIPKCQDKVFKEERVYKKLSRRKMSELLKKRLKGNIGKEVLIFLKNNFRYLGKITNCDDYYLEMLDYKTNSHKLILLEEIKDCEVRND